MENKKVCKEEGCDSKVFAKELCQSHYFKKRRKESAKTKVKTEKPKKICEVDGCEEEAKAKKLCRFHYDRVRRIGKTEKDPYMYETECKVDGCHNTASRKSVCISHYHEIVRSEDHPYKHLISQEECKKLGCKNPAIAKGLCQKHHINLSHARRNGTDMSVEEFLLIDYKSCQIDGCDHAIYSYKNSLCEKHSKSYSVYKAHGKVDTVEDYQKLLANTEKG